MGDRRAAELLRRQGAAEREAIEEIARIGSEAFASSAPALYKDCLQTIGGVFAPLPAGAPAFARTDAWATACTFSALGGWVSIRHQFELHAKDAVFYVGYSLEPPRPSGYVAPYPHVFRKLGALSTKTHDLLERFGVFGVTAQHGKDAEWPSAADVSAGFGQFAKLMDQIAVIAEKQLRGDALMHAERAVLEQYGTTLGRLHFHRGFIWGDAWAEDDMPQAVLFTTSYDDMWSLVESYAATGRAFEVYVIRPAPPERVHDVGTREEVEIPAALQLYRGGVFSFYEWTKFADTPRLTDAKWRQVLDGEAYPESPARLPAWAAEMVFPVEPGHRARASAGLLPAGCEERRFDGVEDPALAEAALQGYLKGGADATGLLRVFLDRGRPEDADQLVALAPRIANPVDLQHVARAFAARASVSSRERLFAAAPLGHLNLLIMAYYAVASGTALENMRTIFGASEEGRWVLAAALGRDLKRSTEMTVDSDAAAAPSPIRPANVRALAALAAEDASFLVRAQAMDALSAAPREEALPVLRRGLADSSSAVRTFAGLSLAALGDTRSYPEIGSVLRGLENPDLRAQVFAEGERMLRAQAYLEDGEQGPRGVEEAYLVMLLLGGLEFVLHEETARVQLADIYARKYVTDPRYWQWGWRCEAADPGFFGDLAIALATDRTGTDRSRADALEGLLYCSSPLSLWHVACLEPLLDDATVADAQTGERFCDMAAGIILRTVEKDGLVSMESEAQRRDAQHRARLALEYATRYSARYSADTRDAREWEYSVPASALDAWNGSGIPQGISPGCVDALVSPWIHHQLGGLVSFEDGALALEYLFLTGLGDLIPAPRSTSLLLQGASWPMSEQTISVGGRRFTIPWLAAGGSGAFYLQPVFRGSVTVECDCTFDFVGEYAPEFTLIVRDGEERHGASFGVRAVRMEDGDAGPRGPKGGSLDRGELPEALISGKPVALRVELRWPDGAEQGALHVFFAGEEVSVLEGVDTAYGRVGLSWSNCYFVIWRLAVAGTLDRGWAVDALYREALQALDHRDSSQTADDLRVRVLDEVFGRPATRPR